MDYQIPMPKLTKKNQLPMSTTSTAIKTYINWLEDELAKTNYGKVMIEFTVNRGQIVHVDKGSIESEHFQLEKKE